MANTSTLLQLTILVAILACFHVSGSEKKRSLDSNGSLVSVPSLTSNVSDIKDTSRSVPRELNVTSQSELKTCTAIQGLCGRNCLKGCCNERCSKRFKNGRGECREPMLPSAPCLCYYPC
ncbi:hypothetical protein SSX86_005584 [Deinandra increscens subsp. villosa]|uniref:Uncharacterized protein n=1 Tax=Deinandra increscens subsp. villosa TaxID=3103831 RepID=A0AAP0HA78_9ASTR